MLYISEVKNRAITTPVTDIALKGYRTLDKGHCGIEIRRYWLLGSVEHLTNAEQWHGLKRVDMIESERRIDGQLTTIERRY